MRDQLLALLEDGPHPAGQLGAWLAVSQWQVRRELKAMLGAGLLKRVDAMWALATYERPRAKRRREAIRQAEPSPLLPVSRPTIHISEGIEFEVVNDCSGPVTGPWPGTDGESSYSGRSFKVGK